MTNNQDLRSSQHSDNNKTKLGDAESSEESNRPSEKKYPRMLHAEKAM